MDWVSINDKGTVGESTITQGEGKVHTVDTYWGI